MRSVPLGLAGLVLGACASAGVGGGGGNSDGSVLDDAGNPIEIDAAIDAVPIDGPPQPVALSQNTNPTPNGQSFACSQTPGNFTRENSYYRVFQLADHGVTGTLQIQMVSFAVQQANAGGAAVTQAAQLKLGKYGGAAGGTSIDLAQITPITATAVTIPDSGVSTVNVPITGSITGGNLIVELAIPDGAAAQNVFFIGTNGAGESKPGYIRSPICNVVTPTGMNGLGAAQIPPLPRSDMIISVSGVHY